MNNYGKQLWVARDGSLPLEEKHFTEANNSGNIGIKGGGGLWTSSYIDKKYASSWVQWCLSNEFQIPKDNVWKGYILTPKKNLNLYRVDSLKDMHILFDEYGYQYIPNVKMEAIDFERMSKDFDGLHLTSHGEVVTRHGGMLFGEIEKDLKAEWKEKTMRNLYGYDCESTFHFKWNFEHVEAIELNCKNASIENIESVLASKFGENF